jgi:hypothetical protein
MFNFANDRTGYLNVISKKNQIEILRKVTFKFR